MKKNKNLFLFWLWFTGVTLGLSYVGNRIYTNNKNFTSCLDDSEWYEFDPEIKKADDIIYKRDSLDKVEAVDYLIGLGYTEEEAYRVVWERDSTTVR